MENEHEYKLRFTALAGERFFRYLINAPVFSLKEWAGIPFEIPAVKCGGLFKCIESCLTSFVPLFTGKDIVIVADDRIIAVKGKSLYACKHFGICFFTDIPAVQLFLNFRMILDSEFCKFFDRIKRILDSSESEKVSDQSEIYQ